MLQEGKLPQGFLVVKEHPVLWDWELLVSCLGVASLVLQGIGQAQDLVHWMLVD